MKQLPEEERKLIDSELQAVGRAAEGTMAGLKLAIKRRRETYLATLQAKTRKEGKVAEDEVWKLVALADLEEDLIRDISRGRDATRRMQNREDNQAR